MNTSASSCFRRVVVTAAAADRLLFIALAHSTQSLARCTRSTQVGGGLLQALACKSSASVCAVGCCLTVCVSNRCVSFSLPPCGCLIFRCFFFSFFLFFSFCLSLLSFRSFVVDVRQLGRSSAGQGSRNSNEQVECRAGRRGWEDGEKKRVVTCCFCVTFR